MEDLLEKSFSLVKMPSLQPVVMCVMKHLPKVKAVGSACPGLWPHRALARWALHVRLSGAGLAQGRCGCEEHSLCLVPLVSYAQASAGRELGYGVF